MLPLAGQVVVVTGRLAHYTRAQAEEQIRRLGGTVGSSVTSKTTLLIVGEDAGSKLARAKERGTRVLAEADFLSIGAGQASSSSLTATSSRGPRSERRPPVPGASARLEAEQVARDLLANYLKEMAAVPFYQSRSPDDFASGQAVLRSDADVQLALVRAALDWLEELSRNAQSARSTYRHWHLKPLLSRLLRRRLPYQDQDIVSIISSLTAILGNRHVGWAIPTWGFIRAFEVHVARTGMSTDVRAALGVLKEALQAQAYYYGVLGRKSLAQTEELLTGPSRSAFALDGRDDWGCLAQEALGELDQTTRERWLAVLSHAATTAGSKPSKIWLARARGPIEALGPSNYVDMIIRWLGLLRQPSPNTDFDRRWYTNEAGNFVPSAVVAEFNANVLKGLAWCCTLVSDEQVVQALGDAAEACFKKVPNVGPRSAKVANACVYALGAMTGMSGVTQLSRLAQRVKLPSARKTVESALEAAAQRSGLTRDDLEEMAIPTFGLQDRALRRGIGSYVAEVRVAGANQVDLSWRTADGKGLRSEPAEVKRAFAPDRMQVKRLVDDLRKTLAAQRDRLERLFLAERAWGLPTWRARYLDHPLVGVLAQGLIWSFEGKDRFVLGAWLDGRIVDVEDRPLDWLGDDTRVRLWHPIGTDPQIVLAWRRWLEAQEVTQPFKQAHREIYVLTDAELATETHSNRFAAHILRQHQLHALCQQRGWQYRLQGYFDGSSAPTLTLPRWNLRAEFWCDGVEAADELSGAGLFLYVTTDQVRFARVGRFDPIPLAEVPALVFSEVMRDVDLFVGVCSVGNDPNWADRGTGPYATYWESYAFGDLSASAETRRSVLERLLPRLTKIAARCTLSDKFLVVRGDLRTYKIHLGSGNILMEPNNQYLCIVSRGGGEVGSDRLFLPFEGDTVLSLILSKAFLLADDRAIKDPTITRQIRL